jgi:hypothetical protein
MIMGGCRAVFRVGRHSEQPHGKVKSCDWVTISGHLQYEFKSTHYNQRGTESYL